MTAAVPGAEHTRACFLRACWLDVAVQKPGNVSLASPGHRMHAGLFTASALAAAGPLFEPGAKVGKRIENAVAASWAAAGCNTNLGILLLCAPLAAAAEQSGACASPAALRAALVGVLDSLDVADAAAAYRAIAQANPGGLGRAEAQDVHSAPSMGLRAAMALAAGRDSIARQYTQAYADVLALALRLHAADPGGMDGPAGEPGGPVSATTAAAVQRVFLAFLSRWPDSHIVRKHGAEVAQTVMSAAQAWHAHSAPGTDPAFAAWDQSLKARGINPGTSADLTVAALLVAGLLAGAPAPAARVWHGT